MSQGGIPLTRMVLAPWLMTPAEVSTNMFTESMSFLLIIMFLMILEWVLTK